MVLRYSTLEADLAKYEAARSKKKVVPPEKGISSPKKRLRFWILMAANVIVWVLVYNLYLWAVEENSQIWELITTDKGMVTGTMYNAEKPCAIVRGEIAYEGDTVDGYRVVKIRRREVELEKNGKFLTKRVR